MKLLVVRLNGTFRKNNKMSRIIGRVNYLCISTAIYLKPVLENTTGIKLKTLVVLVLRDFFPSANSIVTKFSLFPSFPSTLNKTVNESSKDD